MQSLHIKLLLIAAAFIATFPSVAQTSDSSFNRERLIDHYKQKSKKGGKAGLILLSAGVSGLAYGGVSSVGNTFSDSHKGEFVSVIGAVLIAASIPVFVIAIKNREDQNCC